ncbi:MAG: hypothetical protein ABR586_02810 [Thermoplasmatota archaeon]
MNGRWAAIVAILLSGCASVVQDTPGGPANSAEAGGTETPSPPAGLDGGWRLDCTLGAASGWNQTCLACLSDTPRTKAEMWVGINPTDPANVVVAAKDMDPASSDGCVWNGLWVTHDAGGNWTHVVIGGRFADRTPASPFYGYSCNTDPMFRFAPDGTLHYGVEMYNLKRLGGTAGHNGPVDQALAPTGLAVGSDLTTLTFKVLLATSRDGGLTWPDVLVWQPDLGTITDFGRMAIAPDGAVHEILNHLGPGLACHLLSSRDGGRTADPVVVVTPPEAPGDILCRGLAISPSGTLVVAFKGPIVAPGVVVPGGARGGQVMFVRSADGGRTFTDSNVAWRMEPLPPMPGKAQAGPSEFEMAYDLTSGPGRGTLWAITAEAPDGDADVFVRSSHDDGRTCSDPVQVNQPSKNAQVMPNLAIVGDGSLHAFYFDRAGDPDNRLTGITHAWSVDAGATWRQENATTALWDPDLGRHQLGDPWIGDYLGIDAVGQDVWAAFPDASLGGEPVAAAAHVRRR